MKNNTEQLEFPFAVEMTKQWWDAYIAAREDIGGGGEFSGDF